MHVRYLVPPLQLEPVCHLGEVDAGLGTAAWLLDLQLEVCWFFLEFKAVAEYLSLKTKPSNLMKPEALSSAFSFCVGVQRKVLFQRSLRPSQL